MYMNTSFEAAKRHYFVDLASRNATALKLHQQQGLWERTSDGKRDWGNVSEHCVVETARVGAIADMIGLPKEVKKDLQTAAALHDVYKKGEKEHMAKKGLSWESYDEAGVQSDEVIRDAGFSDTVAKLASSVGHSTILETETILGKSDDDLTDFEKAWLVMHYTDDYTINSDWAARAEHRQDGTTINDVDRRIDKNEANSRYTVLNEAGRAHFNGETSFEAQRRVGHQVEQRLANLIAENSGIEFNPIHLPEIVDNLIREEIMTFAPNLQS